MPPIDPKHCPLCGAENSCSMAREPATQGCWCTSVTIAPTTLAAIPEEARYLACLCPTCATRPQKQEP